MPVEVAEEDIVVGDSAGRSRYDESYGMTEMDDMDGMSGYGSGRRRLEKDPPEYKLIRFYDFAIDPRDPNSPKPGRQYVYRVRVAVEDPNFPKNPSLQPRGSSLDANAYVNYMAKVSNVEKSKEPEKEARRELTTLDRMEPALRACFAARS